MKHYKTFGQTNGGEPQYSPPQPQYTPIDQIPMMESPAPQHRAIRNLQHHYPDNGMGMDPRQQHSHMGGQHMNPMDMQQMGMSPHPQHQMVQPMPMMQQPQEQGSRCSLVMKHIKRCELCASLYKQNTNTYLCIIVFLVLLILFLVTKLIDK